MLPSLPRGRTIPGGTLLLTSVRLPLQFFKAFLVRSTSTEIRCLILLMLPSQPAGLNGGTLLLTSVRLPL